MAIPSDIDFLLVRTGLSESFKEGKLNGDQGNDNPLAPEGVLHAKAAGDNLANVLKKMQPKTVQIWTCNGVKRIEQTTQYVLEKLDATNAGYDKNIHSDGRLGGKNHGKFNLSTAKEREQDPEWQKTKEMLAEEKFKTPLGGGESKEDIFNKVSVLFKEISSQSIKDTAVVVVTSNNVLEALGRPLSGQAKLKVDYPEILHLKLSHDKLSFVQVFKV